MEVGDGQKGYQQNPNIRAHAASLSIPLPSYLHLPATRALRAPLYMAGVVTLAAGDGGQPTET